MTDAPSARRTAEDRLREDVLRDLETRIFYAETSVKSLVEAARYWKAEALRAAPASAPPEPDYVALLKQAKAIVNASVLYRRFIEHTPLENDIAVWMADFAMQASESAPAPLPAPEEDK